MSKNTTIHNDIIHDQKEDIASNTSNNRAFSDVLAVNTNRRKVIKGSLAAAATTFLAPQAMAFNPNWKWKAEKHKWQKKKYQKNLVDFAPLTIEEAIQDSATPSISSDYEYQVIIPWGTPIEPYATEAYTGDPNTRPTAAQAAMQIGIGHDGMWFFPQDNRFSRYTQHGYRLNNNKGRLCINHGLLYT